jgi:ribosomal protein L37E
MKRGLDEESGNQPAKRAKLGDERKTQTNVLGSTDLVYKIIGYAKPTDCVRFGTVCKILRQTLISDDHFMARRYWSPLAEKLWTLSVAGAVGDLFLYGYSFGITPRDSIHGDTDKIVSANGCCPKEEMFGQGPTEIEATALLPQFVSFLCFNAPDKNQPFARIQHIFNAKYKLMTNINTYLPQLLERLKPKELLDYEYDCKSGIKGAPDGWKHGWTDLTFMKKKTQEEEGENGQYCLVCDYDIELIGRWAGDDGEWPSNLCRDCGKQWYDQNLGCAVCGHTHPTKRWEGMRWRDDRIVCSRKECTIDISSDSESEN